MKKLILLSLLFTATISFNILYSQPSDAINKTPITKGYEGMIGAQCIGGLIYDDNTWENGYGFNPGYGVGKFVMKITPQTYPFTINQVCLALTRTSAGSAIFGFDIVFYDETGTGGSPGNLVASFPRTATIPIWPSTQWFDYTGLTGIPQLTTGQSYYVGISYDPATMPSHYIAADESAGTPQRPGYGYIQSAWGTIQSYFASYKAIGVRCDGVGITYAHNIAVGPFLSLPSLFNLNVQKVIKAKVTNQGTSNESNIPVKFFVNGTQINSINITSLNANAVDSVTFNWTPADTGNYTLKIVSALANDEYRANDTVTTQVHVFPPGYFSTCYGTGSTAVGYPFYTFYMDSRTDMLYHSNEIMFQFSPGPIFKIGFIVISASPQVMNGFKIKMQNTTLTSISGFITTGWTEVYNGTYTLPGTGIQFITLQTPFLYTGNNLLIEICFNNSSYTNNSTIKSTTNAGRVFHNHQDLASGDGCVNITTGSLQATLPNICFQGAVTGINIENNDIPKAFSLSQNYPNPFNPRTIISYQLPISSQVKLIIYDALGKVVAALVNEKQTPGAYDVEWDGTNYSSGLYFYKLECEGFSDVKKLVLIK